MFPIIYATVDNVRPYKYIRRSSKHSYTDRSHGNEAAYRIERDKFRRRSEEEGSDGLLARAVQLYTCRVCPELLRIACDKIVSQWDAGDKSCAGGE